MSRKRAFAFLATLVAALAMTLGSTATAAQAGHRNPAAQQAGHKNPPARTGHKKPPPKPGHPNHPPQGGHQHYPPVAPQLVVDRGVVKRGETVHATGTFAQNERVFVTVTFRPTGSNRYRTIRTVAVRTDRKGGFTLAVRTTGAGTLVIKASGKGSQNASVVVTVTDSHRAGGKDNRGGHGRQVRRVSYTVGPAGLTPPGSPGVAVAAIAGLLALAGGAGLTRRVVRRRRRA